MSKIEVAVICHNYGRFLRECVDSVLAQSYKDLKVRIIDDASLDETAAVCGELAARDSRVEIHRHSVNIGHIRTYNEAIRLAQADYLLLLSADDFLLPGAIERAVTVLDSSPEVGLVHGAWVFYRAGDTLTDPSAGNSSATLLDPAEFIYGLAVANMVATATATVRTCVQKELGGYLAELPHAGDLEMWLRFGLRSRVAYIDKLQAAYRRHESNMSLGYDKFADFQQCKLAIMMHLAEIRERSPNSVMLEIRIRRRLFQRARSLAKAALREGRVVNASDLLMFSLLNMLVCPVLMLRQRLRLLRQQ